jgi:DNA-binding Lrp family transcriptional regulator
MFLWYGGLYFDRRQLFTFPRKVIERFYVYLDYPRPHNSRLSCDYFEFSKAWWIARPAYITDRSPRNFFLFGYLEEILWGVDIPDRENLKTAIARIFNEISKETLVSVFPECSKQLNLMIQYKNEYYKKQEKKIKEIAFRLYEKWWDYELTDSPL